MNNKRYKFFSLFFISLIIISIVIYGILFYTPPFLDTGKRNFIEKTIDFFCFGWHLTKASIQSDYLKNYDEANRESGEAGWYRKKYLIKKFDANAKDMISVLNVYKNLNINTILEKLYIFLIRGKKSEMHFLVEAGERFIICENWKMSIVAFSRVIDLNPGDLKIHYYLGLSYLQLNKLVKANEYLEKAIKLKPDFADAYYQLGIIAEKEKKWIKAHNLYEKAVNILPNHLESLEALKKINEKLE